ncbi:hypothetical protein HA402_009794 [Bradysia odoriphaga]|nr:hypothetical protein HA402_009794 [Bradysia odoriphaga]
MDVKYLQTNYLYYAVEAGHSKGIQGIKPHFAFDEEASKNLFQPIIEMVYRGQKIKMELSNAAVAIKKEKKRPREDPSNNHSSPIIEKVLTRLQSKKMGLPNAASIKKPREQKVTQRKTPKNRGKKCSCLAHENGFVITIYKGKGKDNDTHRSCEYFLNHGSDRARGCK